MFRNTRRQTKAGNQIDITFKTDPCFVRPAGILHTKDEHCGEIHPSAFRMKSVQSVTCYTLLVGFARVSGRASVKFGFPLVGSKPPGRRTVVTAATDGSADFKKSRR